MVVEEGAIVLETEWAEEKEEVDGLFEGSRWSLAVFRESGIAMARTRANNNNPAVATRTFQWGRRRWKRVREREPLPSLVPSLLLAMLPLALAPPPAVRSFMGMDTGWTTSGASATTT